MRWTYIQTNKVFDKLKDLNKSIQGLSYLRVQSKYANEIVGTYKGYTLFQFRDPIQGIILEVKLVDYSDSYCYIASDDVKVLDFDHKLVKQLGIKQFREAYNRAERKRAGL